MERINQYSFYEFGQKLKALSSHKGDVPLTIDLWGELYAADSAMDGILAGKPIPIGICRVAAQALSEAIGNVIRQHFFKKDEEAKTVFAFPTKEAKPIPGWQWGYITGAITTFETVFNAEMREVATYFVPRCGIHSTPALIDFADESFPPELLPYIPQKTRDDWKSAGRCLAFNLLSASGFHTARAVEGTVETYWRKFSGAKPEETLRSWNDYIVALGKIAEADPTPCPAKKTLTELTQMKDDYRNPIMHPRVVLTESDARMLFDNGESVIIAMADELRIIHEAQGGVQNALALVSGTSVAP